MPPRAVPNRADASRGRPASSVTLAVAVAPAARAITRANQVWALETTYIRMARGFVHLTAVVDMASRRVLAHKAAITLEACHAREGIEQALARWGTPEIVNTDPGSQFTAVVFADAVLGKGCRLSMDGRGAWRDNVFVERLWRSVKYDRVYLRACHSVSTARRADDVACWPDVIACVAPSPPIRAPAATLSGMMWHGRGHATREGIGGHDRTAPHAGQRQQVGISGDQGVGPAGGRQVHKRHVERLSAQWHGR